MEVPGPSHTPHSSKVDAPFGTPAQSKQVELSPPHTPHSSLTKSDPHVLSQPEGAGRSQPQPRSAALPPLQSPQLSNTAVPPQAPAQSFTRQLPSLSVASEL